MRQSSTGASGMEGCWLASLAVDWQQVSAYHPRINGRKAPGVTPSPA